MVAIVFKKTVPSPSLFIVTSADAHVKKYPIDAPIADMSTNHSNAFLPKIGPDKDMIMQRLTPLLQPKFFPVYQADILQLSAITTVLMQTQQSDPVNFPMLLQ